MLVKNLPYTDISEVFDRFNELYGATDESQKVRYTRLFEKFKETFGENSAYVASSSGRVEVCGNHTDHNGGKVVSLSISLDTLAMFRETGDGIITVISEGYPEIKLDLNDDSQIIEKGTSAALVKGVAEGLKNKGYNVGGFNAVLTSNVLGGAGISSSASFEVLIAEILNFLYNNGEVTCQEKAQVSQYAENVYFGKPCGLLDQTAIAYGGLRKLDFANLESIFVSDVKCDISDYNFILINTGGSHADLTDEYASIPKEMKEVANALGKDRLIDVGESEFYNRLAEVQDKVSDRAILRSIHFFEENDRVDTLENALKINDYDSFIKAINESGNSSMTKLQNCYVSGRVGQPIPKAISIAKRFLPNGAVRVHGGGFAGCILCVAKTDETDTFIKNMKKFYQEDSIIPLRVRSVGAIVL